MSRHKFSWTCFVKDHKIAPYTDSSFEICERCKCHEYWDGFHAEWDKETDYWNFTIPSFYRRRKQLLKWWFESLIKKIYVKCPDCNKTSEVFGKPKGNHDRCLPF
jgi:hypothetical protein